jgi:hypothetical protein
LIVKDAKRMRRAELIVERKKERKKEREVMTSPKPEQVSKCKLDSNLLRSY